MSQDTVLLILGFFEGLFWILAYIFIVRRSFKEKIYGMPIIAMCGNIAWEIIYGVNLYPVCPISWPECPQTLWQIRDILALVPDGFIFLTIMLYGANQFARFPLVKKYFPVLVIFGVVVGLGLVYTIEGQFYVPNVHHWPVNGSVPDYLPIALQSGLYTGFALDFEMSLLFIAMILSRNSVAGQSIYIALCKMIGTIFAYLFVVALGDQTTVINILFGVGLVFNLVYTTLVYLRCKEANINPWARF
jgi:hypothetical protein